jgi:hypothetical protein
MQIQNGEFNVRSDEFRVVSRPVWLLTRLEYALAVCASDDVQGVGGLLNLRCFAGDERPSELTDNTLSLSLLLLERFVRELKSEGARAQSLRVRVVAHSTDTGAAIDPAATLTDLVRAFFVQGSFKATFREIRRQTPVALRFEPHAGQLFLHGADTSAELTGKARSGKREAGRSDGNH